MNHVTAKDGLIGFYFDGRLRRLNFRFKVKEVTPVLKTDAGITTGFDS